MVSNSFARTRYPHAELLLIVCLLFHATIAIGVDEGKSRRAYIINPGDQLLITVEGHEKELTALVTVRPDGMVTYPVAGDVEAAGLTISQLSLSISRKLSEIGYYKEPRVTVQLREPSQESIYVFGDVVDPGMKKFPESVSIVEALAAAGGYRETANLANAKIFKRSKEIIPINLEPLRKDPQSLVRDNNMFMMEDGDVLMIPSSVKEKQISIIGHVHKPGLYTVTTAPNLIEALALAGGPLETAADLKHISVIRENSDVIVVDATRAWTKTRTLPADPVLPADDPSISLRVQPGDSVFVPPKARVNILGNVENQGQFAIDTEINIIEALALGGIKEGADLKRLRIVRSGGEQITVDASDVWKHPELYAKEKLGADDTLVVPPKRFKINWSAVSAFVMVFSTLYAVFK